MRRIGVGILALQLVCFLAWSVLLASRYSLTWDFSLYHQALFLIGHGDLNPYVSTREIVVWQDHGQLVLIPMAILFDVWPHPVTLLWMADLAVVGSELVAFLWMCDVVEARDDMLPDWAKALLPMLGVCLLVLNPWMWWGVSFDIHTECFAVFFLTFAAYDFFRDRARAWIWVVLTATCGDIGSTYVVALALTLVFVDWRRWRRWLPVVGIGLANLTFISALHWNAGSDLNSYSALVPARFRAHDASLGLFALIKSVVTQPFRVLSIIWTRRLAFFTNLSPAGPIGLATRWTLWIPLVILLEDGLQGGNGTPFLSLTNAFQNLGVYVFCALGTVMVTTWLVTSGRRWLRVAALGLVGLLLANVAGWAVVWMASTPGTWIRVNGATAAVLSEVNTHIGPDDEVIASQGVVGVFAGRRSVYPIIDLNHEAVPVSAQRVWFVVLPNAGIETTQVNQSEGAIANIARLAGAQLVASTAGVWAFRWDPPAGVRRVDISSGTAAPVPAWVSPGPAGESITTGPVGNWRTTGTGATGYVVSGDYWPELAGRYAVSVRLALTDRANLEVWDVTANTLLARQALTATDGPTTVTTDVDLADSPGPRVFAGTFPWEGTIDPRRSFFGDRLEVRVWTPGGSLVVVYSLRIGPRR